MCKQRECIGIALCAFGAGVILGLLIGSVFCCLLLAAISIGAGCICLRR